MTRNEMIDELMERLEGELDELSNTQLSALLEDFEHSQILGSVMESIADNNNDDADDSDEDNSDDDEAEDVPLIDGEEWDEEDE
jgi:hypothetical protein